MKAETVRRWVIYNNYSHMYYLGPSGAFTKSIADACHYKDPARLKSVISMIKRRNNLTNFTVPKIVGGFMTWRPRYEIIPVEVTVEPRTS